MKKVATRTPNDALRSTKKASLYRGPSVYRYDVQMLDVLQIEFTLLLDPA